MNAQLEQEVPPQSSKPPKQVTTPKRKTLTEEELKRRRKSVDFARVNCELEGLYCTDNFFNSLNEQYAKGEIGLDKIDEYVDSLIRDNSK